jgi:hypothetical protein
MSKRGGMPWRARLAISVSEFATKRGVYLGNRATKVHVAVNRRSNGRLCPPEFVAFYPGYEFFKRNAGGRKIPIVIRDPRP